MTRLNPSTDLLGPEPLLFLFPSWKVNIWELCCSLLWHGIVSLDTIEKSTRTQKKGIIAVFGAFSTAWSNRRTQRREFSIARAPADFSHQIKVGSFKASERVIETVLHNWSDFTFYLPHLRLYQWRSPAQTSGIGKLRLILKYVIKWDSPKRQCAEDLPIVNPLFTVLKKIQFLPFKREEQKEGVDWRVSHLQGVWSYPHALKILSPY